MLRPLRRFCKQLQQTLIREPPERAATPWTKTELNHLRTISKRCQGSSEGLSSRRSSPQPRCRRPSTKADCAPPPSVETQFVSNHTWRCHHTVISCPDTNSRATRSWRSNRIFSERVWRYKGTVTVPSVILATPPPSAGKVQS